MNESDRLVQDIDRLRAHLSTWTPGAEPDEMRLLLARVSADHCFQFIGLLDPKGRVLESNQPSLDAAGITRHETQGVYAWDSPWFSNLPDGQRVLKALIERAAGGEFVRCDLVHHGGGGGDLVTVDFSLTPVRDGNGEVAFIVPEGRDVTEQRRMEQEIERQRAELEKASRAKSEFLAMMSHDIRNPMNAVMTALEVLASSPLPSEQGRLVASARSAGHSLLGLLEDALDSARIESGGLELDLAPLDLHGLAADVVYLLQVQARRDVAVELHCPDGTRTRVMADAGRMRQVLQNLVGNAVKFTERGEVRVEIREEDGSDETHVQMRISVEDTGPGIPEEALERIFERFSQADPSVRHRFGGSGLGLYITRRLVEAMDGRLEVASRLGQGTRFSVLVRLEVAPAPAPLQAPSILLVDDEPISRTLTSAQLRRMGCRVVAAVSGTEAIGLLDGQRFDLVVTDWELPDMDGRQVAHAVRERHADVPILALSGHDMRDARPGPIVCWLRKPATAEALREAVSRCAAPSR